MSSNPAQVEFRSIIEQAFRLFLVHLISEDEILMNLRVKKVNVMRSCS